MFVITVHSTAGSMGEACESLFTVLVGDRDTAKAICNEMSNVALSYHDELYVTYADIDHVAGTKAGTPRQDVIESLSNILSNRFG